MSDDDADSDGESAADFEYGDSQEVSTYEIVERAVHRAGLVFPAFTHPKIPRSLVRQSNEMDVKLPLKFAQLQGFLELETSTGTTQNATSVRFPFSQCMPSPLFSSFPQSSSILFHLCSCACVV
jgi:hypothetical protein